MPEYRQTTRALAASAETKVAALWVACQAGHMDQAEFVAAAAVVLAAVADRSAVLADVALAGVLTRLRGEPVAPLGLSAVDATDRLTAAFHTLLDDTAANKQDPQPRLERLAGSTPLEAGQRAYGEGLRRHGVPGWTRETGGKACKVCRALTGPVLPVSVRMYAHPGCSCWPMPVLQP